MEVVMGNARLVCSLVVAMLVALVLGSNETPDKVPANSFTGRVYDLDYLHAQGWTQALIQSGNSELVAMTQHPLLQRILEVSLLNSIETTVTYQPGEPGKLETALVRSPTGSGCIQGSCVKQIKCDATKGLCIAYIQGQSGDVTTDNGRALGILLTAISKSKPVDYLQLNGQEIVRVKINVSGQI